MVVVFVARLARGARGLALEPVHAEERADEEQAERARVVPAGIARDGVSERVAPGSHWTLLSAGVGAADVASSLVEWMTGALEDEELERE